MRERLLMLTGGIANARWQTDDQLHITLRFIGEVDRHRAADIAATLGSIHHPPFEIALAGVGSFDRKGRIETIWAGLSPADPLRALAAKVDQSLLRVGIAPETRAFLPHVTLARLPRGAGSAEGWLARAAGAASAPFPIDGFCLYESELAPEGAIYSIVERYPLR